jgi:hypothetical protein
MILFWPLWGCFCRSPVWLDNWRPNVFLFARLRSRCPGLFYSGFVGPSDGSDYRHSSVFRFAHPCRSPRSHRRRWSARFGVCERWPSRVVAQEADGCWRRCVIRTLKVRVALGGKRRARPAPRHPISFPHDVPREIRSPSVLARFRCCGHVHWIGDCSA